MGWKSGREDCGASGECAHLTALLQRWQAILRLGIGDLARVGSYRAQIRLGIHPVQALRAQSIPGPFFVPQSPEASPPHSDGATQGPREFRGLGWIPIAFGDDPPDWCANILAADKRPTALVPWWKIPDFDATRGDIKGVWELSRWDWLLLGCAQARAGDLSALNRLNAWMEDWSSRNPLALGPNWKCGQEASIRVLRMAAATLLLDGLAAPTAAAATLVAQHLERIVPTINYARGQANNHWTSEAAALFVGGTWLEKTGHAAATKWAATGRRHLELAVAHLIGEDGSFSQYSVNYHRLMLDTLTFVEAWRRTVDASRFTPRLVERCQQATRWLAAMIADPASGDFPTIGANDGALLWPWGEADYRDLRLSVQFASRTWFGTPALVNLGTTGDFADAIGQGADTAAEPPSDVTRESVQVFDEGGLAVMRNRSAAAYLRYPRFKFRPKDSDALHVDLWVGSRNVIRDAGSGSYAFPRDEAAQFDGVRGHSTIEFDDQDPLPKVGRFLKGGWVRTESVATETRGRTRTIQVAVRDWRGCRHARRLDLTEQALTITDDMHGFAASATLRWRLCPGDWMLPVANRCVDGSLVLNVDTELPIRASRLTHFPESRHYGTWVQIPVWELTFDRPGRVTTRISWAA